VAQGGRSVATKTPQAGRPARRGRTGRSHLHDLPGRHRVKLHSTNPIERLYDEIKRRTDVVGIFPNEATIVRLVGAILLEQNDEWCGQRSRYMRLESVAGLSGNLVVILPIFAS